MDAFGFWFYTGLDQFSGVGIKNGLTLDSGLTVVFFRILDQVFLDVWILDGFSSGYRIRFFLLDNWFS